MLATSTPRAAQIPNTPHISDAIPRSAARFAASAAGAKETTSTRGSASRRCGTERAQESTQASAPLSGSPPNRKIRRGETAPGRLGREDARNFGIASLEKTSFPRLPHLRERQPELAFELQDLATRYAQQRDFDVVAARRFWRSGIARDGALTMKRPGVSPKNAASRRRGASGRIA